MNIESERILWEIIVRKEWYKNRCSCTISYWKSFFYGNMEYFDLSYSLTRIKLNKSFSARNPLESRVLKQLSLQIYTYTYILLLDVTCEVFVMCGLSFARIELEKHKNRTGFGIWKVLFDLLLCKFWSQFAQSKINSKFLLGFLFISRIFARSGSCPSVYASYFFDSTIYVDWTELQQSALSHFQTSIQLLIFPLFIAKLRELGCICQRIIGSQADIWDSLFINQLIICSRAVHTHRNQEPY